MPFTTFGDWVFFMRSHKLVALTYTTNLLTWHYQWTIFVVFSLVMASCGFSDCCHSWHRCQNRNVVKCQNSEITDVFCSVYEFWQFYIWVFNLITQILVNFRSSLQSWDLRFFRGDLRVSISSEKPIESLYIAKKKGEILHVTACQITRAL